MEIPDDSIKIKAVANVAIIGLVKDVIWKMSVVALKTVDVTVNVSKRVLQLFQGINGNVLLNIYCYFCLGPLRSAIVNLASLESIVTKSQSSIRSFYRFHPISLPN